MNAFEFVFTLFGLLLGFSLAEVLGGLVRTLKARREVRLGWLTPLLAAFVMLDLTSFWANAWAMRDAIPPSYGALVLGLLTTGLYFIAASLVFPDRPEAYRDLDDHYYARRRAVLGGVALSNLVVLAIMAAYVPAMATSAPALITHGIYYASIATAAFARPRWLNGAALGVLLALYGFYVLISMFVPAG